VQEVGTKLVRNTDAGKKSPYRDSFQFHLLEHDMLNAFALPGGQIFITTTLFNQLENEAQLAGVLGHEIGHVIHRHAAQQMAKGQLGQSLVGAVAVGASDERGRGQMATMAAAMAAQMLQLKYGRNDESQSDSTGVDYMAQAGYDPREMLGVMTVLKNASKGRGGPEFMQSHPLPDTRLAEIKQLVEKRFTPEQLAQLSKGRSLKSEKW
jgi:predicted Zn-dependent protease